MERTGMARTVDAAGHEIVEPPAGNVVPVSDASAIMAVISRAAADPNVDVVKLERLTDLYMRVKADAARTEYMAALAEMQPELPIVGRRGRIEVREKVDGKRTGDIQQSTPYALWEDINEAIVPVLTKHGFALSFRYGTTSEGRITVTGVLSHRGGHQEETSAVLQHDSTGSKNAVQAVGSSYSYGKRYTAIALLNITSRGDDDDAKLAGMGQTITEEQVEALRKAIVDTGADLARFLGYFKIEKLDELPVDQLKVAENMLAQRGKKSAP
jgi:hypothetical protein